MIDLDEKCTDAYYGKARLEKELGKYEDTLNSYKSLTKLMEDDFLIYIYISENMKEKARVNLKKCVDLDRSYNIKINNNIEIINSRVLSV